MFSIIDRELPWWSWTVLLVLQCWWELREKMLVGVNACVFRYEIDLLFVAVLVDVPVAVALLLESFKHVAEVDVHRNRL